MKCKHCKKGNNLPIGKTIHSSCKVFWNAEHIPKNQKRKLSICPHCHESFDYWQKASLHAIQFKHFGDYNV